MDEIDIEKGQPDESPAAPPESQSGITPGDKADSQNAATDPKSSDEPRHNAKMWALYLEEAEKEAKELAEILKNDLDSLLIFAGLFAGIVASFIIDSRHDLQPDVQQVLLADIRNALRNETAPQDLFQPSTSSLWTNGLWFSSLMITLFSAVLGVLAKSWLVKFTPVVSGKESGDAYRRYIRDEKAKSWYLEQIITAAPLLIQIALCLFALGFGLQSVGDHASLGWTVLVAVFIGIVLYIFVTLLPLFIPWCPLQTPLSDILSDALLGLYRSLLPAESTPAAPPNSPPSPPTHNSPPAARPPNSTAAPRNDNSQIHLSWRDGPNKIDVLRDIWRTKLIQSANPANVDEALAELTRKKLSDDWWRLFVAWGIPKILCQRLQEFTFSTQREYQYEVVCDHLRSLLGFVDYLESSDARRSSASQEPSDALQSPVPPKPSGILRTSASPKPSGGPQSSAPPKLSDVLKEFLDPGNPLNRWNVFPEEIRALAFSARAPIMIACNKDFAASEMEERPWETMVRHMPPDHRGYFAMAACRGLVEGQDGLRRVSALGIVISIAKTSTTVIGPKSEWGVGIDDGTKDEVKHIGQRYLEKLFEEIAHGWKALLLQTLSETSSTSANSDSWDIMIWSDLDSELKHWDSKVRTRAVTMLEVFATDADLRGTVESFIPELVDIVVNDPDENVRAKGMKTLMKLVQNGFAKQILTKVLRSVLIASISSDGVRAHTMQ